MGAVLSRRNCNPPAAFPPDTHTFSPELKSLLPANPLPLALLAISQNSANGAAKKEAKIKTQQWGVCKSTYERLR